MDFSAWNKMCEENGVVKQMLDAYAAERAQKIEHAWHVIGTPQTDIPYYPAIPFGGIGYYGQDDVPKVSDEKSAWDDLNRLEENPPYKGR